jgi:Flp pilus assembly pilin Flp
MGALPDETSLKLQLAPRAIASAVRVGCTAKYPLCRCSVGDRRARRSSLCDPLGRREDPPKAWNFSPSWGACSSAFRYEKRNSHRRALPSQVREALLNVFLTQLSSARFTRREQGQTMAEYAVVLAVISIAIIGAIGLLGTNIKTALSGIASKV